MVVVDVVEKDASPASIESVAPSQTVADTVWSYLDTALYCWLVPFYCWQGFNNGLYIYNVYWSRSLQWYNLNIVPNKMKNWFVLVNLVFANDGENVYVATSAGTLDDDQDERFFNPFAFLFVPFENQVQMWIFCLHHAACGYLPWWVLQYHNQGCHGVHDGQHFIWLLKADVILGSHGGGRQKAWIPCLQGGFNILIW